MATATPTTPSFDAIVKPAKDVFFVTVGLGSMAFDKVKESQAGLCSWVETHLADGRTQLEAQTAQLEERVESVLGTVQDKLPEQAAELMKQARDAAKTARDQLKDLVNRSAQTAA